MSNKNEEAVEELPLESASVGDAMSALFGGDDTLDKLGVMMIMDDIKSDTVRPVIEWILRTNLSASHQPENLTLILNSGGGSVTDGFALIDAMRGSGIPVHTIGLGEVSSAALMIFMAGERGHRTLTPNTSILSHQYSWGKWGKEHELLTARRGVELTSKMITDHYIRCSGMSEKKVRQTLLPPHDVWLSAAEAKKFGICDTIRDMN